MARTQPTVVLSRSQDIPFNKLVLSQANVRRIKTGLSIEELAEDIARRGLLQSLSVRPVRNAGDADTGVYEVPAGGRRFRALELLVKQKRMAKTQPVPCIVREDGIAEEDSLAENVQRVALHPLDQFRAFQTLRDAGLSEEDIAARFFVGANVVKQRLKLVAVSPKLLDLYADDEMTLEQLMAFTVTDDQARQEQVWEGLASAYNKEPYYIRRQLTETAIRASDKRARFVGVTAYEAAGGIVMRDLFEQDNGGWLQDSALLDRLVIARLTAEAEVLRAEGWRWIEVAIEFAYGHAAGLRRLTGTAAEVSAEEQARHEARSEEFDRLNEEYTDADTDDLPEEVARRLDELEAELQAFAERPEIYDPADIARAGAFVSISNDSGLQIARGYVRREDEIPAEGESGAPDGSTGGSADGSIRRPIIITVGGDAGSPDAEAGDEDDGIKPLSERLVTELTAHRTLALRDALAGDPEIAFVAALHALCLQAFYNSTIDSCLEIRATSTAFLHQAPGLAECDAAKAIEARQEAWGKRLPEDSEDLWGALIALDAGSRAALFAHCAALTVNAVHDPYSRSPHRIAHADRIGQAVGLDMAAHWAPTVENYLGRVTKTRILEAVREAKGEAAAELIDHLKKPEMAKEAERLLAGTGWLPDPLRLPEPEVPADAGADAEESLPAFLDDEDAPAAPMADAAE
jgi:ParB family chromosome partitioning protein